MADKEYREKVISIEAAAQTVQSGDVIGTGLAIGSATPAFYDAVLNRYKDLQDVKILDTLGLYPFKFHDPDYMMKLDGHINYMPAFSIATGRKMNNAKQADFYPVMSSDLADKVSHRANVFIAEVTPPNAAGYVNLGLTNFYSMESIRSGKETGKLRLAIGEVNDQMPVIYGNNWMHISEFDYFIENSTKIPTFSRGNPTETDKRIAGYVLDLIDDGDTIQMGIGGIPEAVVSGLEGKKDLGVLTEMFPIGLPQLVAKGIVTNKRKPLHKGVTVATFCMGDAEMYEYVRENPACEFYPSSYTNNPIVIGQHPNMVAMNMALMIDFSGQINSEGVGHTQVSGSGGQLDFMIGAFWSQGGKGITLLYSSRKMKDGSLVSAIVPELPLGTPVTVPRTYTQYVVTEYGVADLRYKSRTERAKELIAIAHPDLRGELYASLKKNFYPFASMAPIK
ncbi:MAG: acetyl-CoA hydrolase/transferase C-terminal domain-containing protein [Syntrophomonadaceae bacterium]